MRKTRALGTLFAAIVTLTLAACGGGGGGGGGSSTFKLTVAKSGNGTVTSQPAGINCGTACNASFTSSAVVTLTATPAAGSIFSAWGGACSGATATCSVTMSQARNVTAQFVTSTGESFALSVAVTGAGSVSSQPSGIDCGTACSANYASGTSVTLTATPASGQILSGWGGACAGTTSTCVVEMTAARSVTASFAPLSASGSWTAPTGIRQILQSIRGVDDVALSANGDAVVVWAEQDSGVSNDSVWGIRYSNGAWGTPTLLETGGGTVFNPKVAMDASGNATVVWKQRGGGIHLDVYTARYDVSSGWGTATLLENITSAVNGGFTDSHDVAMDPAGNAIAAWSQHIDVQEYIYASRYTPTGGWSAAEALESDIPGQIEFSFNPQIRMDDSGNAVLVWGHGNRLHAKQFSPAGGWTTAFTDLGPGALHNLAINAAGDAALIAPGRENSTQPLGVAVWQYSASSGWNVTPTVVDTGRVGDVVAAPKVAIDSAGNVTATWLQPDSGGKDSVFANRRPAGGSWGTPQLLEASNTEDAQAGIALGSDAAGNVFALWPQAVSSLFEAKQWVSRFAISSGAWETPTTLHPNNNSITVPVLAVNPNGKAIAVWIRQETFGTGPVEIVASFFQ
jgi:Divergent InlB B-repeat domain